MKRVATVSKHIIPDKDNIAKGWSLYALDYEQIFEKRMLSSSINLFQACYDESNSYSRIVDAGCGNGNFAKYLLQNYQKTQNKADIFLIDLSKEMVNNTSSKISAILNEEPITKSPNHYNFKSQNIQVFSQDVEDMKEIEDDSVDLLLSNLVLHLTSDFEAAVRDIRRVLNKKKSVFGGTVFGSFDNSTFFSIFEKELLKKSPFFTETRSKFYLSDSTYVKNILEKYEFKNIIFWKTFVNYPQTITKEEYWNLFKAMPAYKKSLCQTNLNELENDCKLNFENVIEKKGEPLGVEILLFRAELK